MGIVGLLPLLVRNYQIPAPPCFFFHSASAGFSYKASSFGGASGLSASVIADDAGLSAPLSSSMDASGAIESCALEEIIGSSRMEPSSSAGPSSPLMTTSSLPPQSNRVSGGSRAPSSGNLSCYDFFHHVFCGVFDHNREPSIEVTLTMHCGVTVYS